MDQNTERRADAMSVSRVDKFLREPANVHRMIVMTERGLPALTGVAEELEKQFQNDPGFDMRNYLNRQTVGRLIKAILLEFGYAVAESGLRTGTHLREFAKSEHFKTSAIYKWQGNASKSLKISEVSHDVQEEK